MKNNYFVEDLENQTGVNHHSPAVFCGELIDI